MNDDGTDTDRLRREVRDRYRDVALRPDHTFDLYTGQPLAERLGRHNCRQAPWAAYAQLSLCRR